MNSLIRVTIILVHYNGEDETRQCLLSLKKIHNPDLDVSVVVVDNGSKEILEVPEAHRPAKTTILRSDTNLGFSNGNNLGVTHALADSSPIQFFLLQMTVHDCA